MQKHSEAFFSVPFLPTAVQTEKPKADSNDDAKQKKQQRNYPVYYVNTKVNGKFGKSVRAFTSEEFVEQYPIRHQN